jgi:hypothetical protein
MSVRDAQAALIQAAFRRRKGREIYSNKVGSDYALSKPKVFTSAVSTRVTNPNLADMALMARGANYMVTEIEGFQHIGAKPHYRETLTKAAVGEIDGTVRSIKLNYMMINPQQTATVFIYKSGSIVINTTGTWQRVVRLLAKDYFKGQFDELMDKTAITNTASRFYCNRNIDTAKIRSHIEGSFFKNYPQIAMAHFYGGAAGAPSSKFKLTEAGANIENRKFKTGVSVSTEIGAYKVALNIYGNGTILCSTLVKPELGPRAFKALVTEMRGTLFSGQRERPELKKPKKEEKRVAMAEARYSPAGSWSATRNNYYVRPGPNGKARFYAVPANKSLVRAKVIKAYANVGVNIPRNVINKLGITNAQIEAVRGKAPKAAGPSGWNNQSRNGYYVRPDKQGRPAWYQIPGGKAAAKKTVIKAYSSAGINVPAHLKKLFKISNANLGAASAGGPVINLGKDKHLRINGKQLERYNKNALVEMAGNLELPRVTEKMKVSEIRAEFERKLAPKVQPINVTMGGVKHTFLSNGTVRRNYTNKASRTRQFSTLKVPEQNAIAQAYLTANEYSNFKTKLAKNRYQFLLNTKAARAVAGPARRASPVARGGSASGSASSSASSSINNNFALELELAMRMGNLAPSPSNLEKLKKAMGKVNVGARGKPVKTQVDAVWRSLTKEFKKKAQNKITLAKLEAKAVVPNWVPANLRNSFKKILVQTGLVAKTKKNAKAAVMGWINAQIPKQGRIARNVENVITGEIKHIPAWNPPRNFKFEVPKLSPKVKNASQKKAPAGTPVKKRKTIPMENKFESLVNNMNRLGVAYNPNKGYSWENLKKIGVNDKYRSLWINHVKAKAPKPKAKPLGPAVGPIKRTS